MRFLLCVVVVAAATLLVGDVVKAQTGFNIDVSSTCSAFSSQTGQCISWTSTGSIQEDTCFPQNALVMVAKGDESAPTTSPFDVKEVAMKDLRVGDRVLAFDENEQKDVFVVVEDWLHKSVDAVHMFVTLTTSSGHSLNITKEHVMKANGEYIEAGDVKVGDVLHHPNGGISTVTEVSKWVNEGLYNPFVRGSGTIYVNGVLCHILTHVGVWAWKPFNWLTSWRNITTQGDEVKDFTHPHVETIAWLAGYGEGANSNNTVAVTMDVSLHDDPTFETEATYTPNQQMYAKFSNIKEVGKRARSFALDDNAVNTNASPKASSSNNDNQERRIQIIISTLMAHFTNTIFGEVPVNTTITHE